MRITTGYGVLVRVLASVAAWVVVAGVVTGPLNRASRAPISATNAVASTAVSKSDTARFAARFIDCIGRSFCLL
jgi:hypothetical protein